MVTHGEAFYSIGRKEFLVRMGAAHANVSYWHFRVRRFRRNARDKAAVCARESKGYKGRTQCLRKPQVRGIQRRFQKMYDRALSSLPGGNSRITVLHDVLSNT
jgi:hypothetical protein